MARNPVWSTTSGPCPGSRRAAKADCSAWRHRGQTVFAYLTTAQDNRVVTMRFDGSSLSEQSPILTGIPAGSGPEPGLG
jgi:hypothetical protein